MTSASTQTANNARQMPLDFRQELLVDLFAGGGGASTGIEWATGRAVDVAVNHDPAAIAIHRANHPDTEHYCESVFRVSPVTATGNQPIALCWFSPDCTSHSHAKGSAPVKKKLRGLAWVVIRWARRCRPRIIMLENVEEFQKWGPLLADGRPCPAREGREFNKFIEQLARLGYRVEYRSLDACDYGAPTIRRRLFMIARRDGLPIVWPRPTHGAVGSRKRLEPHRAGIDQLDMGLPTQSIFERKKPLVDKTLRRIAQGIESLVLCRSELRPFKEPLQVKPVDPEAKVADHGAAVRELLCRHGQWQDDSLPVVQSGIGSNETICPFLTLYYSSGSGLKGRDLRLPVPTITANDRMQLVKVHIDPASGVILDISTRMLTAREMYDAQGFPPGYIIDKGADGLALNGKAQKRLVGNSVSPHVARALVAANLAHELSLPDLTPVAA